LPGRSTTRTPPKDLQQIVKTKKTELLFLALFLRLLKPGGHAAVIVPDGVLFGSSNAHKTLRKILVEDQKLDAVISLPGGVFKPYAGVSTAILLFTKPTPAARTTCGSTLWTPTACRSTTNARRYYPKKNSVLHRVRAWTPPVRPGDEDGSEVRHSGDGWNPVLTPDEHVKNNLPDILIRWRTLSLPPRPLAGEGRGEGNGKSPSSDSLAPSSGARAGVRGQSIAAEDPANYGGEHARKRTEQSFLVPKADIAAQGYDLSINRYKEVVHKEIAHRPPSEILSSLSKLEAEIQQGMKELEGMLR